MWRWQTRHWGWTVSDTRICIGVVGITLIDKQQCAQPPLWPIARKHSRCRVFPGQQVHASTPPNNACEASAAVSLAARAALRTVPLVPRAALVTSICLRSASITHARQPGFFFEQMNI